MLDSASQGGPVVVLTIPPTGDSGGPRRRRKGGDRRPSEGGKSPSIATLSRVPPPLLLLLLSVVVVMTSAIMSATMTTVAGLMKTTTTRTRKTRIRPQHLSVEAWSASLSSPRTRTSAVPSWWRRLRRRRQMSPSFRSSSLAVFPSSLTSTSESDWPFPFRLFCSHAAVVPADNGDNGDEKEEEDQEDGDVGGDEEDIVAPTGRDEGRGVADPKRPKTKNGGRAGIRVTAGDATTTTRKTSTTPTTPASGGSRRVVVREICQEEDAMNDDERDSDSNDGGGSYLSETYGAARGRSDDVVGGRQRPAAAAAAAATTRPGAGTGGKRDTKTGPAVPELTARYGSDAYTDGNGDYRGNDVYENDDNDASRNPFPFPSTTAAAATTSQKSADGRTGRLPLPLPTFVTPSFGSQQQQQQPPPGAAASSSSLSPSLRASFSSISGNATADGDEKEAEEDEDVGAEVTFSGTSDGSTLLSDSTPSPSTIPLDAPEEATTSQDQQQPPLSPLFLADDDDDDDGRPPPFEIVVVPPPKIRAAAVVVPSITSNGLDDAIDSLQLQLERLESEIYTMNSGGGGDRGRRNDGQGAADHQRGMFNINSPRQVSEVLFGRPDMATNRDVLEGMATSNILAKLILEYRHTKQRMGKALLQRRNRTTNAASSAAGDAATSAAGSHHNVDNDPILLMDTSSFIFRAYYSMPPMHRGDDGMPVGAVLGFCNMLNRLVLDDMVRGERPRLVLCCDAPALDGRKTFRHELYDEYKGNRRALPLDLIPQFALIQQAAQAYGLVQVQAVGYEADDVLATLSTQASRREGHAVRILSGDKDLMQLITGCPEDKNEDDDDNDDDRRPVAPIEMVDPMTSTTWTHDTVVERWGVGPSQLGDVLALAGDAADNVPGVPGIGPKIAAQLLQEYGTLKDLLDNTHTIKQKGRREKLETYRDQALLSRELVELKRDLEWSDMQLLYPHDEEFSSPFEMSDEAFQDEDPSRPPQILNVADLRMQPMNADRILEFYEGMGFHTIKQRFLERLSRQSDISYGKDANVVSSPSESVSTSLSPETDTSSPSESANDAASSTPKPKRNWYTKKKMGIPKPEDYEDVPF